MSIASHIQQIKDCAVIAKQSLRHDMLYLPEVTIPGEATIAEKSQLITRLVREDR